MGDTPQLMSGRQVAATLVAPFLLGLASLLSGCLGYGAKDTVASVIEEVYRNRAAENCYVRQTQRFVEQTTFSTGQRARRWCVGIAGTHAASSLQVSDVSVRGETATAHVAIRGGRFDGQRHRVRVVMRDGRWMLDSITWVDIERHRFDRAMTRLINHVPGRVSGVNTTCFVRLLRQSSDAEIERAIVSGDPAPFRAPFANCRPARRRERKT